MNEVKAGDLVQIIDGSPRGEVGVVNRRRSSGGVLVDLISGPSLWFGPEQLSPAPVPDPGPDLVQHPNHYTAGVPEGIEVIDIIRAHMAAGGTWETGNALKYILRHTLKGNPAQDIAKAAQYLTMWTKQQQETT